MARPTCVNGLFGEENFLFGVNDSTLVPSHPVEF